MLAIGAPYDENVEAPEPGFFKSRCNNPSFILVRVFYGEMMESLGLIGS